MFDALVQARIEDIAQNLTEISEELVSKFKSLRSMPCFNTLGAVIKLPEFKSLVSRILQQNEGSEAHFIMTYLKDVSSMLAMVSAVREADIERHLEAEREIISQTFAFNHLNYARYLSYQHAFLRDMQRQGHPAFEDLRIKGFGGSISGERFSAIHGDLITELFNKKQREQQGHFAQDLAQT